MTSSPAQLAADAAATETALTAVFDNLRKGPAPLLADAMAYAVLGGG